MVNYLQIQPGDSASVSFVESKRFTALALCKKLFKNKDLYPDPPREKIFYFLCGPEENIFSYYDSQDKAQQYCCCAPGVDCFDCVQSALEPA